MSVERGGARRLIITDNGHGMTRDLALLSLERHAASRSKRSRYRTDRYARLSRRSPCRHRLYLSLLLTTRTADQLEGTLIRVEGGKILTCKEVGCPVGTQTKYVTSFLTYLRAVNFFAEQTELSHIAKPFSFMHSHTPLSEFPRRRGRTLYQLHAGTLLTASAPSINRPSYINYAYSISPKRHPARWLCWPTPNGTQDRTDQFICKRTPRLRSVVILRSMKSIIP